jgi:hypothetical protein
MGNMMIRAAIIQHIPDIRKNMALANSMIVTAFMKGPFRLYLSFDNDRFRPPATSFGHGVYNERGAIFAQRCAPRSLPPYKPSRCRDVSTQAELLEP